MTAVEFGYWEKPKRYKSSLKCSNKTHSGSHAFGRMAIH